MVKFVLIASDVHQSHLPESAAALGCTWSAQHARVFFEMPPGISECNFWHVVCKWISGEWSNELQKHVSEKNLLKWSLLEVQLQLHKMTIPGHSYSVVMWSPYTDLNQYMIIYIIWYTVQIMCLHSFCILYCSKEERTSLSCSIAFIFFVPFGLGCLPAMIVEGSAAFFKKMGVDGASACVATGSASSKCRWRSPAQHCHGQMSPNTQIPARKAAHVLISEPCHATAHDWKFTVTCSNLLLASLSVLSTDAYAIETSHHKNI